MTLILSLFPGIGLLDMAFEAEGYTVVRGPDLLWGGDVRRFTPPANVFVGVIGGPPCQTFSPLSNLVRSKGYEPRFGNLIPEYERCVQAARPYWFLMEEVTQAPAPSVAGYAVHSFTLDHSHLDAGDGIGHAQERVRMFSFGVRGARAVDLRAWIPIAALRLPKGVRCPTVTAAHAGAWRPKGGRLRRYTFAEMLQLQGLPDGFLSESPLTDQGKRKAIANGVPLAMGRALACAIKGAREKWVAA